MACVVPQDLNVGFLKGSELLTQVENGSRRRTQDLTLQDGFMH